MEVVIDRDAFLKGLQMVQNIVDVPTTIAGGPGDGSA